MRLFKNEHGSWFEETNLKKPVKISNYTGYFGQYVKGTFEERTDIFTVTE